MDICGTSGLSYELRSRRRESGAHVMGAVESSEGAVAAGGGQRPFALPAVSSLRGRFLWTILWDGKRGHEEVQAAACNEVLESSSLEAATFKKSWALSSV